MAEIKYCEKHLWVEIDESRYGEWIFMLQERQHAIEIGYYSIYQCANCGIFGRQPICIRDGEGNSHGTDTKWIPKNSVKYKEILSRLHKSFEIASESVLINSEMII